MHLHSIYHSSLQALIHNNYSLIVTLESQNKYWKFIQFYYIINNQLIQVYMSFDMCLSLLYHQMYKDNMILKLPNTQICILVHNVTVEDCTVHNVSAAVISILRILPIRQTLSNILKVIPSSSSQLLSVSPE